MKLPHSARFYGFSLVTLGAFSALYFTIPTALPILYNAEKGALAQESVFVTRPEDSFLVTHVDVPDATKAIYMSQCVAGTPSFRDSLVSLVQETELNSVVIDIKDYTGTLVFKSSDPLLKDNEGGGCRASDIREFIGTLHAKGIYVIGRITVFQDPFYTSVHPELAVKRATATSTVWTDYKGLSFIEVGAREFWEYIVAVGRESYELGFDELNFDYIRFPSDGNMHDIYYPFSEKVIVDDPDTGKAKVLRNFFAYLNRNLKDVSVYKTGGGPVLSADLFGMTTTNPDDLNIGQILEYALPYFDYVAPMVYPSHFPRGFNGWQNPNEHVYDVVNFSMSQGIERILAASSSPEKLRPWLQDFNYGGDYGAEEVRAQIQAVYDAGLTSWMLWDPGNTYTRGGLETVKQEL